MKTAEALERMVRMRADHSFGILSNPGFLAGGAAMKNLECSCVFIGGPTTREGAAAAGVLADIYANWVPMNGIGGHAEL